MGLVSRTRPKLISLVSGCLVVSPNANASKTCNSQTSSLMVDLSEETRSAESSLLSNMLCNDCSRSQLIRH